MLPVLLLKKVLFLVVVLLIFVLSMHSKDLKVIMKIRQQVLKLLNVQLKNHFVRLLLMPVKKVQLLPRMLKQVRVITDIMLRPINMRTICCRCN